MVSEFHPRRPLRVTSNRSKRPLHLWHRSSARVLALRIFCTTLSGAPGAVHPKPALTVGGDFARRRRRLGGAAFRAHAWHMPCCTPWFAASVSSAAAGDRRIWAPSAEATQRCAKGCVVSRNGKMRRWHASGGTADAVPPCSPPSRKRERGRMRRSMHQRKCRTTQGGGNLLPRLCSSSRFSDSRRSGTISPPRKRSETTASQVYFLNLRGASH